jgi:phytoene dehydrogenase-like protein
MEIGIVGAGIAGLAASIRAAVAGHKVTVLKNRAIALMQVHPFLLCLNM